MESEIEERIEAIEARYGSGADGSCPTPTQWRRIASLPADQPISLINFFALREHADYADDGESTASGSEAMGRYAAVSGPTLSRVGGRFLLVGPSLGSFVGHEERWDMVAVGSYPDREALLALFEDAEYQAAFRHRSAACERQRVDLVAG